MDTKSECTELALKPYKAGPMAGCKIMQAQSETRSMNIPGFMSQRVLIFVVDLAEASLLDSEERKLDEVTEDILDAFGIAAGARKLEFIIAGYDGLNRTEIKSDKDLMTFFAVFNITGAQKTDEIEGVEAFVPGLNENQKLKMKQKQMEIEEKERRDLGATKKELSHMRLGGILTKIQMHRFVRQLTGVKKVAEVKAVENYGLTIRNDDLQEELGAQKDRYDALELQIPYMIQHAVVDACNKLRAELEEKHEKLQREAVELTKKEMRAETERQMRPLRTAIERLQNELRASQEKISKLKKELEAKDREIQRNLAKYAQLQEEMSDVQNELQEVKDEMAKSDKALLLAEITELKDLLKQCYQLLEENGIPLPGKRRLACDANTFRWSISNFEIRAQYQKNHSCQSPEFSLEALEGRCQLEFFPGGIDSSYEGWSAVKLRLPHAKKIRIQWQITLGEKTFGPREDEFREENWWCRCGQLLWSNMIKLEDLNELIYEGSLPLSLEVLSSEELFDDPVEEDSPPSRLQMRCRKKLPQVETRSIYSDPYATPQSRIEIHLDGETIQDPALESFVIEYLRRRGLMSVKRGGAVHALLSCESPKMYPGSPKMLKEAVDDARNMFYETAPAGMFHNATLRNAWNGDSPKGKKYRSTSNDWCSPKWMQHPNSPKKGVSGLKPLQRGFPSSPHLMSQTMSNLSSPKMSSMMSPKNRTSPTRKSKGDKCAMSRILGEG